LGLVTAEEGLSPEFIDRLADVVEKNVDIEALLTLSLPSPCGRGLRGGGTVESSPSSQPSTHPGINPVKGEGAVKIAIARDQAFSFYYEDNFDILRDLGAEMVFFSPLTDKVLPEGIAGLYIGGGYPELDAERLSTNQSMMDSIKNFAESGGKIYAECGGFMYLTKGIVDFDGEYHPMVGVFPTRAKMLKRRKALGYVEVEAVGDNPLAIKGSRIRGHEFHYSEIDEMPETIKRVYRVNKPGNADTWMEGYVYKNTLASYVHLHFGSNIEWAKRVIKNLF
ncbi:MAG: cobyrinate a,c-diamide synthase, partial [Deltaproteobacteria bacterium]|nr:cobyrinate a,c-diamide synthase [Deltaproteobacteria bacterium]